MNLYKTSLLETIDAITQMKVSMDRRARANDYNTPAISDRCLC